MIKIKKNHPVLIFAVAAGLLFFLHSFGLSRPVENLFWAAVKPLSGRLYAWGESFSHFYRANQNQGDLSSQVDRLNREIAGLTVANSQCREIEAENRKLRSALQFGAAASFRTVVANVIAKEAAAEDSRGLIIDRGTNDGLRPDLGVISEDGTLVGKVVEAKAATAKVCLTTSPDCQLAATLQNQERTQGLTDGDLGLTIKMSYIPQLEKIAPGDPVITSGLGGDIPRGLLIGRVTKVYNASNEVWQEATIEAPVNFDNLTIVSVVIP
ncbi:MAG: rod shape-determining protein MreC [Patescibacteria group bacterium]